VDQVAHQHPEDLPDLEVPVELQHLEVLVAPVAHRAVPAPLLPPRLVLVVVCLANLDPTTNNQDLVASKVEGNKVVDKGNKVVGKGNKTLEHPSQLQLVLPSHPLLLH
jgi:hypothetical protein